MLNNTLDNDNRQWYDPKMNEIFETLNRAIIDGPISLTFASSDTARRWVFRAHNYIRRHDPSMRQLMIGRRENVVRIEVPQFTVATLTNGE